MFRFKNSAVLRANDGVCRMSLDRCHPVLYDFRAVLGQILSDESKVLFRCRIAIFGISIHELKGIEARMHAADQIKVQPPMLC